ncbi:hypothetical protein KVM49_03220 [Helicobacter pylori]|nr:hypothetical protein KVM49_03220 [Helicobacter pylori]
MRIEKGLKIPPFLYEVEGGYRLNDRVKFREGALLSTYDEMIGYWYDVQIERVADRLDLCDFHITITGNTSCIKDRIIFHGDRGKTFLPYRVVAKTFKDLKERLDIEAVSYEWGKEQRAITEKLKTDYHVSDTFISYLNELIRKKSEQGYKIITDFKACEWCMSIAFKKEVSSLMAIGYSFQYDDEGKLKRLLQEN